MSAPMIQWMPMVHRAYKYLTKDNSLASSNIHISSVEIHDVETAPEHRARTLKHLLKANHANFALFSTDFRSQNYMSHILGSAFLMGATPDQLHDIYDAEEKQLAPWEDSPAEVAKIDWTDELGDISYLRAYLDFFEDQLVLEHAYKWKFTVEEFLFEGKTPLINCVIGGLGYPLVHLGYAFEFSSKELAMEALAAIATTYNDLYKLFDDDIYIRSSTFSSTSPLEILRKIAEDDRFGGVFKEPAANNFEVLMRNHKDIVMEYWNAWVLENPVKQFQESQEAAVALLVATVQPGTHSYNFLLARVLTTSHAVRVLLPLIPSKFHSSLVRQWWLLTVGLYIAQLRPNIDLGLIGRVDRKGRNWAYVEDKAINSSLALRAHYVDALRAMREASVTWGDNDGWYLSAAIKFADDIQDWTAGPHDIH